MVDDRVLGLRRAPTFGIENLAAGSALRPAPTGRQYCRALEFGVFFIGFLASWIRLRQHRARLAEPKLELPEQPLALPRSEFDFE